MAAALYLILLHAARGWPPRRACGSGVRCCFLLRRPIAHRTAVCVLGLLTDLPGAGVWGRFFCAHLRRFPAKRRHFPRRRWLLRNEQLQAIRLRPADAGRKKSCTAVIYFDEADGGPGPEASLSGHGEVHHGAGKSILRGKDYDSMRGVFSDGKLPRAAARRAGTRFRLAGACYAGGTARATIEVRVPVRYGGFVAGAAAGRQNRTQLRE